MSTTLSPIVNFTFTFMITPEMQAKDVALAAKTLRDELSLQGFNDRNSSINVTEKGPNELNWIKVTGKTRMKMPKTFDGTREEYAALKLESDSNEVNNDQAEESNDESDTDVL